MQKMKHQKFSEEKPIKEDKNEEKPFIQKKENLKKKILIN